MQCNMKQLTKVCRTCKVPVLPEFEVRYFAAMICPAGLSARDLIQRVGILESHLNVHCVFYLRQSRSRMDPNVSDSRLADGAQALGQFSPVVGHAFLDGDV